MDWVRTGRSLAGHLSGEDSLDTSLSEESELLVPALRALYWTVLDPVQYGSSTGPPSMDRTGLDQCRLVAGSISFWRRVC